MKKFMLAAISAAIVISSPVAAKNNNELIKPKIVGGEQAESDAWPWMSALVYTGEALTTSLSVGGVNYESEPFTNGPSGDASGELMDCGIGDQSCSDAQNKICLIERGEINFSVKAENCESGGGVGVVIYNNVEGTINGTLGDDFSGTIPVVSITQEDGLHLKENSLGEIADISISSEASTVQNSTCGASFLGGKWVLTAAHCVDGASSQFLKVNVGEYDLSNGAENAVSITQIYMHPDYDDVNLDNDVALIELVEEVDAPAVSLASDETTDVAAADANTVTVIGWGGRTGYAPGAGPTGNFPDILHQVDLQLMTNQQCKEILANSLFGGSGDPESTGISEMMICAAVAGGGKSSCQGDSGGPLVLNTNEGWQQVGVVSWGYGCAAEGFPGVFARIGEFDDWLTGIYQGIAITQRLDFHVVATEQTQSTSIRVSNNSEVDASVSYEIDEENGFSLVDGECSSINAGESCQLTVNFSNSDIGSFDAKLEIETDNSDVETSESKLMAQTIAGSSDIETVLGADENVNWYSGGEQAWVSHANGGIESGTITHLQDSIAMAVVTGEGELSFEWAVSSEENTEDPSSPYDALFIYINGEEAGFISGEVEYEAQSITLTGEENRITWVYNKDPAATEGDDKGYLRNVSFTPTEVPVTPTPTPTPTPVEPNKSSSGGGSFGWLLALSTLILFRRK
ncbi:trypsin-like serine protease [Thalassotalea sp. M1531]|uniref:Trypsin-like serine protease n=1 Tax=Thalassotalea algicola TaxID=2716224 RepID=A0A7Y0LE08_9GAMM|nr:trypsin-like serine protease [Thalassotalea algicola]NMP32459.1 trypsin-like serine protease [Thalassotalea algicola]